VLYIVCTSIFKSNYRYDDELFRVNFFSRATQSIFVFQTLLVLYQFFIYRTCVWRLIRVQASIDWAYFDLNWDVVFLIAHSNNYRGIKYYVLWSKIFLWTCYSTKGVILTYLGWFYTAYILHTMDKGSSNIEYFNHCKTFMKLFPRVSCTYIQVLR